MAYNKQTEQPKENKGGKPIDHVRAGAIAVTTWENSAQKNGQEVKYNTFTIQRCYMGKDGKLANTNGLRVNDIPKAILTLQKVYEKAVLKETEEEA